MIKSLLFFGLSVVMLNGGMAMADSKPMHITSEHDDAQYVLPEDYFRLHAYVKKDECLSQMVTSIKDALNSPEGKLATSNPLLNGTEIKFSSTGNNQRIVLSFNKSGYQIYDAELKHFEPSEKGHRTHRVKEDGGTTTISPKSDSNICVYSKTDVIDTLKFGIENLPNAKREAAADEKRQRESAAAEHERIKILGQAVNDLKQISEGAHVD